MEPPERQLKYKAPWAQMSRCLHWRRRSGAEARLGFLGGYGRHLKRPRSSALGFSWKETSSDSGCFPRFDVYWLLCCTVCGCGVCTSHLVDLLVCLQRGGAAIISWV